MTLDWDWSNVKIKEVRDCLKESKMKQLAVEGKARDEIKKEEVKYIRPRSKELKELAIKLNRTD